MHPIGMGDFVLFQRMAFKGRHKSQNLWETIYCVEGQPYEEFPVFRITPIAGGGNFTKICLCLYLLFQLGALQWSKWNLYAYSSCWAIGKDIVPGGLTGRVLTWTVRGVDLIPTWGKSIFSPKWMYDEYLHLLGEGKVKIVYQNLLLPFGGNIEGSSENEGSQQDVNRPWDCILAVSDDWVPETEVVFTDPEP